MNFLWIFIFLLISDADETANFPEARRTCGETQWNKKYEFVIAKSYTLTVTVDIRPILSFQRQMR